MTCQTSKQLLSNRATSKTSEASLTSTPSSSDTFPHSFPHESSHTISPFIFQSPLSAYHILSHTVMGVFALSNFLDFKALCLPTYIAPSTVLHILGFNMCSDYIFHVRNLPEASIIFRFLYNSGSSAYFKKIFLRLRNM